MSTLQPWLKYWFTPMPEGSLSWRGARGILRGTHFKSGTNREPEFRLEETGAVLGNFTCRQCRRTESRRKWVWNMPSKPPSKMALRWSVSAGWVTAAQSLILCSRQPAPDSLAFRCASPINGGAVWRRGITTVLTPGLCRAGRRRRDPYL